MPYRAIGASTGHSGWPSPVVDGIAVAGKTEPSLLASRPFMPGGAARRSSSATSAETASGPAQHDRVVSQQLVRFHQRPQAGDRPPFCVTRQPPHVRLREPDAAGALVDRLRDRHTRHHRHQPAPAASASPAPVRKSSITPPERRRGVKQGRARLSCDGPERNDSPRSGVYRPMTMMFPRAGNRSFQGAAAATRCTLSLLFALAPPSRARRMPRPLPSPADTLRLGLGEAVEHGAREAATRCCSRSPRWKWPMRR